MFKSAYLLIAATIFLTTVAYAADVTVPCTGLNKHAVITMKPDWGMDGEILTTFDPIVISAKCVDEPGKDKYVLAMPGEPTFASVEAMKVFLKHLDQNGFAKSTNNNRS